MSWWLSRPISSSPDMVHLINCPLEVSYEPFQVFIDMTEFFKVVNSGLKSPKSPFSHFKLPSSDVNFSGLKLKKFKCRMCFGNSKTSPITWSHSQIFKIKKKRHRSSVKTEDGFYIHDSRKNNWSGEVFVDCLNGHHETFKGKFIKWTIHGEMPIGLESHQDF